MCAAMAVSGGLIALSPDLSMPGFIQIVGAAIFTFVACWDGTI